MLQTVCPINKFTILLLSIVSSLWNINLAAALAHKQIRSKVLFALNNFTDLYESLAVPQDSPAIKAMDLTSDELNTIDVGVFDAVPSSRNLQLDTKENTGKY